ncbi:DUF3291 domain-containing protein [Microbulbifer sp. SAOS-129_SWC]|uniref:DUF3291 domain-containing protein n=1 Tax=Microbulbifer sp. SAOS-129_SWC TaxID=3145235 RepID=UPI0032177778
MSAHFHLAQVNIARARGSLDSDIMRGFVEQLDAINALADRSPGFVWRLQTDDGDATSIDAFGDPRIIVNMSVWESLSTLKDYVYAGDHLKLLQNKKSWFEKMAAPSLALWWIPAGTLPTIDDARRALAALQEGGSTAAAFTFARPCPPPESVPGPTPSPQSA